jgi:hypothetical protein
VLFGRTIGCADRHGTTWDGDDANGRQSRRGSHDRRRTRSGGPGGTFTCVATPANDGANQQPAVTGTAEHGQTTGTDQDGALMASNAHAEHLDGGYGGAACTACHTVQTAATHITGART